MFLCRTGDVLQYLATVLKLVQGDELEMQEGHEFIMWVPSPASVVVLSTIMVSAVKRPQITRASQSSLYIIFPPRGQASDRLPPPSANAAI